jgi:hypothetical protein
MELQQESRRGASFAECRGVHPNRSRLSRAARCLTSAAARPHTQAVLQGAFILAKAKGGAKVAAASVDHLRRYIELLLQPAMHKGRKSP